MARTPKLSDMQLILLATACQRADGSLLPPPDSLGEQGARIRKAVEGLIKRSLAEEVEVASAACSWREEGERKLGVTITAAGRAIIVAEEADEPVRAEAGHGRPLEAELAPAAEQAAGAAVRGGTKQALLIHLLRREDGATLDDLVTATGWLPHTTRAALTGLRKKGHCITRTVQDGVSRYTIAVND